VNKSPTHRILVGNQRERTTLGRGFLSFLVYLVTILYCLDIVWSKDLSAYFFCFLPILDREFSFLFLLSPTILLGIFFLFLISPTLLTGNFLSFFAFSHSLIGNFLFLFSSEGKD